MKWASKMQVMFYCLCVCFSDTAKAVVAHAGDNEQLPSLRTENSQLQVFLLSMSGQQNGLFVFFLNIC